MCKMNPDFCWKDSKNGWEGFLYGGSYIDMFPLSGRALAWELTDYEAMRQHNKTTF